MMAITIGQRDVIEQFAEPIVSLMCETYTGHNAVKNIRNFMWAISSGFTGSNTKVLINDNYKNLPNELLEGGQILGRNIRIFSNCIMVY